LSSTETRIQIKLWSDKMCGFIFKR
jgi:hypothetical protein